MSEQNSLFGCELLVRVPTPASRQIPPNLTQYTPKMVLFHFLIVENISYSSLLQCHFVSRENYCRPLTAHRKTVSSKRVGL